MTSPPSRLLTGSLLFALAAAVYLPTLQNGYIWDDDDYVTANPMLRSLDGLARIWTEPTASPQYYPMVFTGFWIEYRLWGLSPLGYHLTNLLLHALAALLFWLVLVRLRAPGALLAAAVFAVHPVHVETVAWITERKNVLSMVFYLGAALAYFRFNPPNDDEPPAQVRLQAYLLALTLFIAALLSKTVTSSLPAALLLVLWWRRGRIAARDVWPLVPWLGLAAAFGWQTAFLEKTHVGALDWGFGFVDHLLLAAQIVWFYAAKLAWPHPLIFFYPHWNVDSADAWQYLPLLALLGLTLLLWAGRRRIGRGPLVALLFFGGTLFPALGFIDVYPMRFSFVADHFQYLASLGPIALFAAAGATLLSGFRRRAALGRVAALTLLLLLAGLSWTRERVYRSEQTLWLDTVARNPGSWMAHNNLGLVYEKQGDYDRALAHYRESNRIHSDHAEVHNNIGVVLLNRGELPEATEALRRALEIDPEFSPAYYNLGLVALKRGALREAALHFEQSLRILPDFPPAREQLERVRKELNNIPPAGSRRP